MHAIARLVAAVGVLACATSARAAPDVYPLANVHRGQTGYGMTTMAGTTPERFTFEVVSVVKNFLPKQDIILVKSDDPKLAVTPTINKVPSAGGTTATTIGIAGVF